MYLKQDLNAFISIYTLLKLQKLISVWQLMHFTWEKFTFSGFFQIFNSFFSPYNTKLKNLF